MLLLPQHYIILEKEYIFSKEMTYLPLNINKYISSSQLTPKDKGKSDRY